MASTKMTERKQENEINNLKVFRPLLILCNFLAILAPTPKPTVYNGYAIMFQLILVAAFLHSVYGKQSPLFETYSNPIKIIDQIANLFLTAANVATITLMVLCYPKKIRKMLRDIVEFDNSWDSAGRKKQRLFWVCLVLFHLSMGMVIFLDLWAWVSHLGFRMYQFYAVKGFQFYHLGVTVALMFWLAVEIRHRFEALNKSLIKVTADVCNGKTSLFTASTYKDIKNKAKLHSFLCDVVNSFNDIFGIIILFTVLFFIAYIVQYAVQLIAYTVIKERINGITFGFALQIASVVWILECLITLMALAAAGDHLSVEAKRTAKICYTVLNNIDVSSRSDLRLLKGELKLLAQQAVCRNACMSASGFFVINFSMMGFILTSVTSYIIVAIQFLT